MDNPRGKVLSLIPGADGDRAIVSVEAAAACPRCAAGKGCGAGIFASGGKPREVEAVIADGLHPEVNDDVELVLAPDNLLHAASIVYGLPTLGAVAGAAIAYGVGSGDAAAAILAIVGLGAGILVGRWRLQQANCLRRFTPRIERLC